MLNAQCQMSNRRLYQQTILERSRKPRYLGVANPVDLSGNLSNPFCGDSVEVTISLTHSNIIQDLKFQGTGCALCMASADLMAEIIEGKTLHEAQETIEHFHQVMLNKTQLNPDYKRLKAIEGAKRYPIKVKCVTLAWHALKAAIEP